MKELQAKVQNFVQQTQLHADAITRFLDLTSELGELAKEILKSTHYGKAEFVPNSSWEIEMGDAFFALICLANATNVNLETALNKALEKYENRLDEKGELSSGR